MPDSPDDHLERLFEAALERPAAEREAFLNERCNDPDLRSEVISLLRAREEASEFFESFAENALPRLKDRAAKRAGDPGRPDPLGLNGQEVAGYEIEEYLGGGGMGRVYRAGDPELDRPVALKFLPPHLASDPEASQRFDREARATARLDHPHVSTVYETGRTSDGRPFIAMAYHEGRTLDAMLEEGSLPLADAVRYARQIARGLEAAHRAGIVHRDVKPSNVLITPENEVKILDFGLAHLAEESELTETGRRLGTASYMSPEQVRGESVDQRTDLWGLGVLLYEMLAGRRPFQAERKMAVLGEILHGEPTPLRDHRPEVSSELARIVHRCLAKDPDERYESAEALLEELKMLGSGDEIQTDRRGTEGVSMGDGERSWFAMIALGGLLLALVAGLLVYVQLGQPGEGMSSGSPVADDTSGVTDRSIAVLPFENIGGEESVRFARGMHDGLLTRLSQISDLKVISRTSVMGYRTTEKTVPEIGRELGVEWVIEGTVKQAAGEVEVDAKLINAEQDDNRWATSYRRKLDPNNLFAIQSELTRQIARSLDAQLTPDESERVDRRPTEDMDAYLLYVQGRQQLAERTYWTDTHVRQAIEYFRRALAQDSSFALAWSGLADAAAYYPSADPDSIEALGIDHERAARRALELNPQLAEAHTSLGVYHYVNMNAPAARRELRRAIELKPSYWAAHFWFGELYDRIERDRQAFEHVKLAVELNPNHARARHALYDYYNSFGEYEKSLEAARRQQRMGLEQTTAVGGEVRALMELGRLEEARQILEKEIAKRPPHSRWGSWFRVYLAGLHVQQGDTAQAQHYISQLKTADVHPRKLGSVYRRTGQPEKALAMYEQFTDDEWRYVTGLSALRELGEKYPYLRETSRYQTLLSEAYRAWGLQADGSFPDEPSASG